MTDQFKEHPTLCPPRVGWLQKTQMTLTRSTMKFTNQDAEVVIGIGTTIIPWLHQRNQEAHFWWRKEDDVKEELIGHANKVRCAPLQCIVYMYRHPLDLRTTRVLVLEYTVYHLIEYQYVPE